MTLIQAFKVWWSYSWRSSLLVIPLWAIMAVWTLVGLVSTVQKMQLSGKGLEDMNVSQLAGLISGGFTLSILSMVATAAIQVFAMRWTLNSRWSDFRLKAVPPDAQVRNDSPLQRDTSRG